MPNLVQWIEEEADGEVIEGVVIGKMGWGDFGSKEVPNYSKQPKGELISWDEAKKWLDYEFNLRSGAQCNAVIAWTKNKIIAMREYDGEVDAYSLPRNPIGYIPTMI